MLKSHGPTFRAIICYSHHSLNVEDTELVSFEETPKQPEPDPLIGFGAEV